MSSASGTNGRFASDSLLQPPLMLSDWQTKNYASNRWSRYKLYLDFYRGLQWSQQRVPGERRITVNYARAFIQKTASYFMGKGVQFELVPNGEGENAQLEAARCEAVLKGIWEDNGLSLIDYDAAVDCAVLGDGAFKVSLQPIGDGDALEVETDPARSGPLDRAGGNAGRTGGTPESGGAGYGVQPQNSAGEAGCNERTGSSGSKAGQPYRVVVREVDVNGLDAGYRTDDIRSLRWVSETYQMKAGAVREQYGTALLERAGLGRAGLDDHQDCKVVEHWSGDFYGVYLNEKPLLEGPNPYGFIPYVLFPNRSIPRTPWGESDLEDVMALASELNIRISLLSQLLQMTGNPVLVLENVDEAQNIRVGPGAVWSLPEGAKASLLELLTGGAVDLHVKYIELVYKMLHDLTEAPSAGFGRDEHGTVGSRSGVALEMMLHPVLQRVARKRLIWENVLDRRNRMMLKLAGLPVHRSRIIWPDVLPRDRAALVTQEVGLVASSIHSLQTARRNLGDEQPARENDLLLQEREKLGLAGSPGTLGHTGRAVNAGGAGGVQPPVHLSGALVQGLSGSAL